MVMIGLRVNIKGGQNPWILVSAAWPVPVQIRNEGHTEVVRKEEQDHLWSGSELKVDDILISEILNDLFSYLCDYIM